MWQALGRPNEAEALATLEKSCKSATNARRIQKLQQQQALEQQALAQLP
jgi:hypothetical protein